ncbi:hypothetical protein, partial [Sporomusa sp.]|uniref:hypothetical protein n=1 Tax=Sporomusa sp. TaxID=2078658 RepID=UPI002C821034
MSKVYEILKIECNTCKKPIKSSEVQCIQKYDQYNRRTDHTFICDSCYSKWIDSWIVLSTEWEEPSALGTWGYAETKGNGRIRFFYNPGNRSSGVEIAPPEFFNQLEKIRQNYWEEKRKKQIETIEFMEDFDINTLRFKTVGGESMDNIRWKMKSDGSLQIDPDIIPKIKDYI